MSSNRLTPTTRAASLDALAELVADRLSAPPVERVTLTRAEAAAAIGASVNHFERHVQPGLRVIRSGSKVLIPVAELHRWVESEADPTSNGGPQ